MKKIIAVIMAAVMLLGICPVSALASENVTTQTDIEYFEDGSYIITEMTTNTISTFATKTVSKSKSSHYYDSNNNLEWTVTLSASFNYTGSSATCTSASTSHKIYDDAWKVTSAVPSKSGNKATGNFTVKRYFGVVPVQTVNRTITITCSNSGVCS